MARALILHVEDDPDDAFFVSRALRLASPDIEVQRMVSGEHAIEFLKAAGQSAGNSIPNLILLDLKLPGLSGFDVLAWAKNEQQLKHLPVVVLSGSPLQCDRARAQALGATRFCVKSEDYTALANEVLGLCAG